MNATSYVMVAISLSLNLILIFAAIALVIHRREEKAARKKAEEALVEARYEIAHLVGSTFRSSYPEPGYRVVMELNHRTPTSQDRLAIREEPSERDVASVQLVWVGWRLKDYLINAPKENGSGWKQYHASSMWDMFTEIDAIVKKKKARC